MIVKSQSLRESTSMTSSGTMSMHRLLGALGMIGSPFLFLSFAVDGFENGDASRFAAALGLVFAIGWLSNVIGLWQLRATGERTAARILLGIQLVTVPLAGLFQVYEFAAPGSDNVIYTITDIAWPLSMLLLLITGIVMIRARIFEGWLRFTVLIAALWLPLSVLALTLVGDEGGMAIGAVHTVIGWFLVGYAIRLGGRLTPRG